MAKTMEVNPKAWESIDWRREVPVLEFSEELLIYRSKKLLPVHLTAVPRKELQLPDGAWHALYRLETKGRSPIIINVQREKDVHLVLASIPGS